MKDIASAITATRTAAHLAVDRAIKSRSGETDPQLQIYNSLPKEGFDALVNKYGPDNVIQYIQAMEKRKMNNGR